MASVIGIARTMIPKIRDILRDGLRKSFLLVTAGWQ